ncbi:autotransporter outer membrane beta-barrel domain-containing protein, partial [Stenotrophomonas sp. P5_B8]
MNFAVGTTLSVAITATLALTATSQAATLTPGQSGTVQPGDTAEGWALTGANLQVLPGGQTLSINATDSSILNLSGGQVTGNTSTGAIRLSNSQADIQDSVISNATGRALSLASTFTGGLPSSEATVRRSTLTGLGLGASVSTTEAGQRALLTLDATRVEGLANGSMTLTGGNGLLVIGTADVLIGNGSAVIGARDGMYAVDTNVGGSSNVVIDASRVEGGTGSGIYVAPSRATTSPPTAAVFTVRNNGELAGGNGNLLFVEAPDAIIGFNIDDSRLTGNILNTVGSTLDVALSNGAGLTGATRDITSMRVDNARWQLSDNSSTGTLALGAGGEVALGDGSAFHTLNVTGNYTGNGGTLLFNTVLAGDDAASDKLVIGGDTSGQTNVRVNNVGGAGAQTINGIELVTVASASNGQFDLVGRAVGGQYDYFLFKNAGNWYLRSQLPTAPDPCDADPTLPGCGGGVDPVDPVDPVNPVEPPVPVLRPEGGAYLANLQATQTLFRLGYHDRHAGQNSGRAWARVDGSRTGFDAVGRQLDVHGNSQSLSVGADVWRNDAGSGAGVMLSSGNATSTS